MKRNISSYFSFTSLYPCKRSALFYFFLFFSCHFLLGQEQLFTERDTVKFSSRTGGELDSVDMSYSNQLSTFPGGGLNFENNTITPLFIKQHAGLQNFRFIPELSPMKFSAVPHIGFSYSFGAKGTQFLHYDYQQAFSRKTLINIEGKRISSAGFLRNSNFNDNLVSLQLRHYDRIYSMVLEGSYSSKKISLSGGITDDSNLDIQGLDFLPVAKADALDSIKLANVKLSNYFNFLADSSNAIGLVTKHQYQVESRVYLENEYIPMPLWNIDSMETRDQYRLASVRNSAGFYSKAKRLYIDALVQHRYWDFQNLSIHHDTNELNFTSKLRFDHKVFLLNNDLALNIIGAGGEWSNKSSIRTNYRKIKLIGSLEIEQKLPEPFQRFYFSNYHEYNLSKYELQSRLFTNITASYTVSSKISIQLNYSNSILHNNYFFIDTTWRNDTLTTIAINSFSVSGSTHFKFIYLLPKITFNLPTANFNYLPSTSINARLFIKKRMFKAQKMEGIVGVDASWISSYNLLNYNTPIDVFVFNTSTQQFNAMSNLSVFFGFAIDEFRFYARMENIGYFWNDKHNQVLTGYPIQKNFLRLGITWDFFN